MDKQIINEQFEALLNEGVHDKGIFKAVFLTGGPGSGKDYVLKNTLHNHGLVEISSDKIMSHLKNVDKEVKPDVKSLRQSFAIKGKNGIIINGTGDDHQVTKEIKGHLENLGYDTAMVHVHTDDEVSKKRNIERAQKGGRVIPEIVRKSKWDNVQYSRQHHARMFGPNYIEFDNTDDLRNAQPELVKQKKDELIGIHDQIHQFLTTPPDNVKAQEWINKELETSKKLPIPNKGTRKMPHPESLASQQAFELGLNYFGQGRYGKNRKITHYAINDNLVAAEEPKPTDTKKKKLTELREAVSITITGDSSDEVTELFNKLNGKNTPEVNTNTFSDKKDVLTLGKAMKKFGSSNEELVITNDDVTRIIGDANVSMDKEAIHEREGKGEGYGLLTETKEVCSSKEKSGETKPKSIASFRESIDKGIEPGLSMATSGENLSRGADKKNKKEVESNINELTGDESTGTISSQKEDELKKKAIPLSSFRANRTTG
jgi:hypothetical protein